MVSSIALSPTLVVAPSGPLAPEAQGSDAFLAILDGMQSMEPSAAIPAPAQLLAPGDGAAFSAEAGLVNLAAVITGCDVWQAGALDVRPEPTSLPHPVAEGQSLNPRADGELKAQERDEFRQDESRPDFTNLVPLMEYSFLPWRDLATAEPDTTTKFFASARDAHIEGPAQGPVQAWASTETNLIPIDLSVQASLEAIEPRARALDEVQKTGDSVSQTAWPQPVPQDRLFDVGVDRPSVKTEPVPSLTINPPEEKAPPQPQANATDDLAPQGPLANARDDNAPGRVVANARGDLLLLPNSAERLPEPGPNPAALPERMAGAIPSQPASLPPDPSDQPPIRRNEDIRNVRLTASVAGDFVEGVAFRDFQKGGTSDVPRAAVPKMQSDLAQVFDIQRSIPTEPGVLPDITMVSETDRRVLFADSLIVTDNHGVHTTQSRAALPGLETLPAAAPISKADRAVTLQDGPILPENPVRQTALLDLNPLPSPSVRDLPLDTPPTVSLPVPAASVPWESENPTISAALPDISVVAPAMAQADLGVVAGPTEHRNLNAPQPSTASPLPLADRPELEDHHDSAVLAAGLPVQTPAAQTDVRQDGLDLAPMTAGPKNGMIWEPVPRFEAIDKAPVPEPVSLQQPDTESADRPVFVGTKDLPSLTDQPVITGWKRPAPEKRFATEWSASSFSFRYDDKPVRSAERESSLPNSPPVQERAVSAGLPVSTMSPQLPLDRPVAFVEHVVPEAVKETIHTMLRHIAGTGAPNSVVEISLHPKELGQIRLDVAQGPEGTKVTIFADRAETLDLIRGHMGDLAAEFRAIGIHHPIVTVLAGDSTTNALRNDAGTGLPGFSAQTDTASGGRSWGHAPQHPERQDQPRHAEPSPTIASHRRDVSREGGMILRL